MKLLLCGDVVPTVATAPAFERGDARAVFGDLLREFAAADAVVVNLECALTDSDAPIRKCGPNLKGRPVCARTLRVAGITHAGLSNNHVCDFGVYGLHDTERALDAAGIARFGSGSDDTDSRRATFIDKDGVRVGVYAVCEHEYSYALPHLAGSNPFDPFLTMSDIRRFRAQCDMLVVMYHGGKEQCRYPSPRLRRACRAMVEAGADIVLTQHSHCVGCREQYMGAEIVYGEGNFCFVAHPEHPHWQSGLALSVKLDGARRTLEYIPVVPAGEGVTVAAGETGRAILDGFEERSLVLADDDRWLAEWRGFCDSVRGQYFAAARDAFTDTGDADVRQVFPHYLDCEAHLDIWQTIFETWHRTDNE